MKFRVKTIIALILSFVMMFCLFSCINNGDSQSGNNTQSGTNGQEAKIIIVKSADIPNETIDYFAKEIAKKCNVEVATKTYISGESYGENAIYIGKLPTEISETAYKRLDRIDTYEKEDMRYLVYGKGGTLAIASDVDKYGVNGAVYTVIDEVVKTLINTKGDIVSSSGTLSSGVVNVIEYQREKDQIVLDQKFSSLYNQILNKLGGDMELADEIYKSIKNIYGLYTDDMISWMANLYDPDTGGFYYSNSARNTFGYLPDIESTAQMLDIITSSGLCTIEELPDWLKDGMVRFVKGLQDENGYFYHPQWGKTLTDSNTARRSRDLSKAISLLNRLGAKPTYDTPSGVKGDGILASKVKLTSKLSKSTVSAVSKVVATASFDYKSLHLESVATFEAWLKTVDINSSSYQSYYMGDKIATITNEVVARDAELKKQGKGGLVDALVNWLYEKQNKTTGLWVESNLVEIDGMNGLFKVVSALTGLGAEIKYPMECFRSTMAVLNNLAPEEIIRVCDVFNIWNNFVLIKQNVNKFSKNQTVISEVNAYCADILKNSAVGLENSVKGLALFVRQDGSMSYAPGTSAPTSHGMPVAVAGTNEGDVNGTALGSVGTVTDLMAILGLDLIPIFTKGDRIEFISLLEDMGSIIKHESVPAVAYDFEDEDVGDGCLIVTASSVASSGGFGIVEREDGAGKALLMNSHNNGGDYIYIQETSGMLNAQCFIIEADIRISTPDSGAVAQLQFSPDAYMLNFGASDKSGDGTVDENDHILIYEQSNSDKSNWVMNNFGNVAKVDEWFNLRLEYYPGDADTVRIKIFVNDKVIAVTDTFYGKIPEGNATPKANFTHARFIIPSARNCDLYIDNIFVTKTNDLYAPSDIPEGDPQFGGIVINVDSPNREHKIYNFDTSDAIEDILTENGSGEVIISDGMLVLSEMDSKVIVPVNMRNSLANCGILEADVTVPKDITAGSSFEILFRNTLGNPIVRLFMIATNENGSLVMRFADGSSGKAGDIIKDFYAPIGESFKVGIDYYKNEGLLLLYLNGSLVTSAKCVCSGANTYRYTNLEVTNNSSFPLIIDNLVAERKVKSLDEATSPNGPENVYTFDSGAGDIILSGASKVQNGMLSVADRSSSASIPINRRSVVGSSVTFVSDIAFESLSANGGVVMKFEAEDGTVVFAYEISTSDNAIRLHEKTGNKKYDYFAEVKSKSFKISVEYYPINEICEIFIDGERVYRSSLTYVTPIIDNIIARVVFDGLDGQNVGIDNVRNEIYEKLYIPSEIDALNVEDTAEKFTFETSYTDNIPSPIYSDLRSTKGALRITEGIINGKAGKVLKYITSAGNNDSLYIPVLKTLDGANGVAFQADMKLDLLKSADGMEIYLQAGTKHATKVVLKYAAGDKVQIYDNISGTNFNISVDSCEWFNFRLEYSITNSDHTGDGKADALIKIYINGEHRGTGYGCYDMSFTADRVTRVRLYTFTASAFNTYLDNLTLEQFNMDTAPHEHNYSSEWLYDKDGHYHKATCNVNPSCNTATTEKLPHTFNKDGMCVCGYEKPAPHVHKYSENWYFDGEVHYHKAICNDNDECKNAKGDLGNHEFDVDGKCVCGYKKSTVQGGNGEIIQNPNGWTNP